MMPIETFNISYHVQPVIFQHGPSWALTISRFLGIQVIGIDGNILPSTALVLMFAVWGIWYWVLMIKSSIGLMPRLIERLKDLKGEK